MELIARHTSKNGKSEGRQRMPLEMRVDFDFTDSIIICNDGSYDRKDMLKARGYRFSGRDWRLSVPEAWAKADVVNEVTELEKSGALVTFNHDFYQLITGIEVW